MMESGVDKSRQNEMTEATDLPLTEPLIVPVLSVSGFDLRTDDHIMHFVGWVATPAVAGDGTSAERRIVMRFDMSIDSVRPFRDAVTKSIPRGH